MAGPLQSFFQLPETEPPVAANLTATSPPPYLTILEWFLPGFSEITDAVQNYSNVDLNLYIHLFLSISVLVVCWSYVSDYLSSLVRKHFMSVVDIRNDDEIYNIMMAWVASQKFAQGSRKFVVNTKLSSRSWYVWRWDDDEDDEDDEDEDSRHRSNNYSSEKKKKALSYTPSMGTHYFWYRRRLLIFRRSVDREQNSFMLVSEREEITLSCFGRNPWILKELLMEAREKYLERDEHKTQIYRGVSKTAGRECHWQRCMSRASRPFSTVILNEETKKELLADVSDYLNPATRRWYANRGIPYRRGYLLHGPPGTGKSSLSLALAGYWRLRIYIVSLNSVDATEENLADLFSKLPRRCVVLLEDIDTAGLTHTREETAGSSDESSEDDDKQSKKSSAVKKPHGADPLIPTPRLSLSGLLNILDGVASQEGRVLIMTTNHVEKLDKALIRPGRVDMIVKFGLADKNMTESIFRNIFAHLEGDESPADAAASLSLNAHERKSASEAKAKERARHDAEINELAKAFAAKIPEHEFSPAELQGHLMKHKHSPQRAVDNVEEFVVNTRKDHKEKELKAAEEKRQAEKKKAEEAKKKADEENTKKEEEAKKKAEDEIKKTVEEEIQKRFGDAIRKEVEAKILANKRKKQDEDTEADKSDESDENSKSSSESEKKDTSSSTTDGSAPATKTSPIEEKSRPDVPAIETVGESEVKKAMADKGHLRQDSGYATPSSGEP